MQPDPAATFARVLAFLGEAFDPAILDVDADVVPAGEPGRPDAAGPISASSIGRWKRDLDENEQGIVRRIAGETLAVLGYAERGSW